MQKEFYIYNNKFIKSIAAGTLIGLGVVINTQASSPELGALLFSFGLLSIIYLQLPLYTGRIGFIEKDVGAVFGGNFIGIITIISLYMAAHPTFTLAAAATAKFAKTPLQFLIDGIICGILIHCAVRIKKPITTIFAVMIFILIGAEHCIADTAYFLYVPSWDNFFKLCIIILGNSIGAIIFELIVRLKENRECLLSLDTLE